MRRGKREGGRVVVRRGRREKGGSKGGGPGEEGGSEGGGEHGSLKIFGKPASCESLGIGLHITLGLRDIKIKYGLVFLLITVAAPPTYQLVGVPL